MVDASALPAAFIETLRHVHDDAAPWLAALPETLARLESAWGVRVTGLVPQLSYNLVAYAERIDGDEGGTPTLCVLKLSPPSYEMRREGETLVYYAGDGICQLLERDDAVSALLLERLTPGVSLQERWTFGEDDAHTRIATELMLRLWRPVPEPNPFWPLKSWARALWEVESPRISAPLQARARELFLELAPTDTPVLLHADLHHGNILTTTGEPYRAIDPKGIVGARGYDIGTYLLNPTQAGAEELIALLPQRLELFSETLGLGKRELAAWGFVHAVLSACWDADMHGDWDLRALTIARALEPRV